MGNPMPPADPETETLMLWALAFGDVAIAFPVFSHWKRITDSSFEVSRAMSTLTSNTLSSSHFIYWPIHETRRPKEQPESLRRRPSYCRRITVQCFQPVLQTERSLEFEIGDAFFRHESATGRDLGVLAASLYRKSEGSLRVLDAMCGCGVRSLRYLVEAEADFVMANDANGSYGRMIADNLKRVDCGLGDERRWVVNHQLANKVMMENYLRGEFYDLIDIDSFGSDSIFMRDAFNALKLGGLLYLTSTDGYSSGGHRPYNSLAAYGAFIRPMPFANEIGLRMLIGGAVREASLLGYHVKPLFSYYSFHGPVFRVLLQVNRGKLHESRDYGFIAFCKLCGNYQTFAWEELGQIGCCCTGTKASAPVVVSGPLWISSLHEAKFLKEMLELARRWKWIGDGVGADLEKLLLLMIDESDPKLKPGYIKMDEMASRAKINSPPLKLMIGILQEKGYAASRSHIISNAIKTDCSMSEFVRIAKDQIELAKR